MLFPVSVRWAEPHSGIDSDNHYHLAYVALPCVPYKDTIGALHVLIMFVCVLALVCF